MEFFDALVRYEIALWNVVGQALSRECLVSLGQLHALRILDNYDGQARVQELSSDIGITVGAASKLVDRLERDGLAERSPNPANRRSSLIALTPSGRHAMAAGLEVAGTAVDRAVGGEDVGPLLAVLARLQTRLGNTAGVSA